MSNNAMSPRLHSKPTLRDVALHAGCSTAVVSTVINNARGNTLVSQEMNRRVWAAARELGYRPNFASRSLARRSAETIGVYVPPGPWSGLGMRYEGAIVQGIERVCRTHGYDVLAINLGGSGTPEVCIHKFAEQRIDGLILLHVPHNADWLEALLEQSSNVAAVNYYGPLAIDRVNFDDRAAAQLAVRQLTARGHRRIAFAGSLAETLGPGSQLRAAGHAQAMTEAGLTIDPRWVWDQGQGVAAMDVFRGRHPRDAHNAAEYFWTLEADVRPTAILAYNDLTAAYLVQRLLQLGADLPGQLSIVGVDGTDWCDVITPSLSSVRQPFAELGCRATELVVARAKRARNGAAQADAPSVKEDARLHLVAPQWVERQSVASLI
jgi:LacI family transcriptional regulator